MESPPRILLIHEVAVLLRVAVVTIYRWLAERRDGRGHFPLPISERGKKLRWLASDIESFLRQQSQSNVVPPVNVVSATAQRREAKKVKQRREAALAAATATLERHKIGRKPK